MRSQKGQFFIVSTIIVAFTLVGIQFLFAGYNIADASVPFTLQEDYVFQDLKEAINTTYRVKACPAMERNLQELKDDAMRALQGRGMDLFLSYNDPCAGSREAVKQTVTFTMNVTSFNYVIHDGFVLTP